MDSLPLAIAVIVLQHPFAVACAGAVVGGEQVIVLLAMLAGQGVVPLPAVVAGSYLGTLLADTGWFLLGRSRVRLDAVLARLMSPQASAWADRRARQAGLATLISTKFLYGSRILTILYLGRRMPLARFARDNAIATALLHGLIVTAGWLAGRGLHGTLDILASAGTLARVAVVTALVLLVVHRVVERWASRGETA